jgi:hypothetical protein
MMPGARYARWVMIVVAVLVALSLLATTFTNPQV